MPKPEAIVEAARDWLRRGEVDLATARMISGSREDVDPWVVAFHAQQAVEKALKAALTMEQTRIPRTHELERLVALLASDWALPDAPELAGLSRYAVAGRYPGGAVDASPEPDWDDASSALRLAERVAAAVRAGIEHRDRPPPELDAARDDRSEG